MTENLNLYLNVFKDIFKDEITVKFVLIAAVICVINVIISWTGILVVLVLIGAFALSTHTLITHHIRNSLQSLLITFLSINPIDFEVKVTSNDDLKVKIAKELDISIESFYTKIVNKFINEWYTKVSADQIFIKDVKKELAEISRKIVRRIENLDHAEIITKKLIPVVFTHIEILDRINRSQGQNEETIKAFIENENPIHPATYNRNSELDYLRSLSKNLMKILVTKNFTDCQVLMHLLKEILSCCVFLPLMDVISDPGTINQLVILATNSRVHKKKVKSAGNVILLENFVKSFVIQDEDSEDDEEMNETFLKNQEELYNFMQYLKSRNGSDIELLKFYLDVEQMNNELENSNVIRDPKKLSDLQQKSEDLLLHYQNNLFEKFSDDTNIPKDLLKAHEHARKILQKKWKNDFCRSSEYFRLIYGDRENSNLNTPENPKNPATANEATNQKFSSKFKNAMTIKTGTIEGLEAQEIHEYAGDAMDYPSHSSYLAPVAYKFRRERGQDLDNFMITLFNSIEQDTDLGEDIMSMQLRSGQKFESRKPIFLGNLELYKNLFNISGQSHISQFTSTLQIKSNVDCVIYFLSSILKVHNLILRITKGIFNFFPDSNKIIRRSIDKILRKSLDQVTLAELISELEVKIFDSPPEKPATKGELDEKQKLAMQRIENVNRNLRRVFQHLQNPVLNKHLFYCLLDLIVIEIFPEIDHDNNCCVTKE